MASDQTEGHEQQQVQNSVARDGVIGAATVGSFIAPKGGDDESNKHQVAPEENSDSSVESNVRRTSALSWIFILWTIPTLCRSVRTRLERTSVPKLQKSAKSEDLLRKATKAWVEHASKRPPEKRSMVHMIWTMQKWHVFLGATVGIMQGLLFSIARPLLLRQVIIAASDRDSPIENAMGIVVAFCIVVLLEGLFQAISKQILSAEASIRFWAWCTGLLQWKATRVDASEVARSGAIEATSLVGHHISRLLEEWRWGCMVFFSSTAVIGGAFVLGFTLGVSSLPGLAILAIIFTANMRVGTMIRKIERKGHEISAKRISLTQDLAANVLGLKLAAWEEPFKKLLTSIRGDDTKNIRAARAATLTSINLGRASPVIASSVSILVLAVVDPDNLTAATIFTALTAFQGMRLPLIGLPSNIIMIQNARVTFEKILKYLNLPDTNRPPVDPNGACIRAEDCTFTWTAEVREVDKRRLKRSGLSRGKSLRSFVQRRTRKSRDVALDLGGSSRFFTAAPGAGALVQEEEDKAENSDSTKATHQVFLSGVNVEVNFTDRRMVAIVGVVASGKTSLLKGLLGQLHRTKGELFCSHNVGYIPQKPFVLSGTILENITMGDDIDENRLSFALLASDFINDLPQFPHGLESRIGERGQTLSGGQRQRLAICRALFKRPELVVADDCLSAVDTRVANTIFNGLVDYVRSGTYGKTACLMALNQLHFLPRFDWVVVVDHGKIVEQGKYADLKDKPDGVLHRLLTDQPTGGSNDEEEGRPTVSASEEKDGAKPSVVASSSSFYTPSKPDASKEKLYEEEKGARGTGFWSVLKAYLSRMGCLQLPLSLGLGIGAYALTSVNDILLAYWIRDSKALSFDENVDRALRYFGISIGHVVAVELLSLWNMRGSVRSSRRLHSDVVETLLHAPVSFYETTPSGRIVSRLSGDLSAVDRNLAFIFDDAFHFSFVLIAMTVTTAIIVPPLVAFLVAAIVFFAVQLVLVDRTNREAKRFANQALAPILTNLSESINSRTICQLMNYETFFIKRHCTAVDEYNQYTLLSMSVINFGTMITGFIAFFVSTGAAFLVVLLRDRLDPSLIGLALVYSQTQPYFLGILSTILPIGLSALTSLERILEFCSAAIPSERPWHTPVDEEIAPWPSAGHIEFDRVELTYRPSLPPALRGVTFSVEGGEVVGIVGRTGAGKSSILVSLLRIHEISGGRVLIDGVDVATVGLQTLRKAVVVIPQEPVLLAGSVMFNIDPFGVFAKDEILQVADRVGLEQASLDKSSAELLSAGERQLLQMTRAILRKKTSHIVILDEPTSNIDASTDKALELIVREEFKGKTRLVIAHRLSTVVNSDKIVVMQRGVVLEFGSPSELLSKDGGEFRAMLRAYNEANKGTEL